jgi:glycosyltransferase involved in cell wall biosynthesis
MNTRFAKTIAPRHLLISLGKSSPDDGGIFEFSSQLAQRLVPRLPQWQQRWNLHLSFHVRKHLMGCFGDHVAYLPLRRVQRWVHLPRQRVALWHSTHQLNPFKPPLATTQRLVTVHDLNYRWHANPTAAAREHRRMQGLLKRADHLVAISHHTEQDIQTHLDWLGPLEVIYNGAQDLRHVAHQPVPGLSAHRPFLFHLSRMTPSKNPQSILDLAQFWPDMQFLMCGAPSEDAKALAATNQLPNVTFALGISNEQKAWAYAHCSGFLFPSLTEGFGLPPIEAMHFGKPVFLSDRTCLPEIGGDAAHYFESFSPAAMKAVVELGLLRHHQEGRQQQVMEHAQRFNWDQAAQHYMSLYERLLDLPSGALTID